MKRLYRASALLTSLFRVCVAQDCQDCQSYGIDFQPGGSYFQNSESSDSFTALQEFGGCSNDTSNNIFVDPNGDQYECTLSQLQPDDTPQLVTCPLAKDQLFDGEYSLIIISNNGHCEPIAYQRDFTLSVGPQQTTFVPPTISLSTTSTPVVTDLQTTTQVVVETAPASTTTVPRATLTPTVTRYPLPRITVVTKAIFTVTKVQQVASIVSTKFVTTTPKCKPTMHHRIADPVAQIAATILDASNLEVRDALPVPTATSGTTEFKRAILEGRAVGREAKKRFVQERRDRVSLNKRAPDQPVVTSTDIDAEPVTSITSFTAPPTTVTGTSTILSSVTTTPTITVSKGLLVKVSTVTAAQKTITLIKWKPVTTLHVTKMQNVVLTITETSTPAGASASCAVRGGTLA